MNCDGLNTPTGRSSLQAQDAELASGGQKLGCSLYEVESGRRAWPYHYHGANKESIYWLLGSGTFRVNGEQVSISESNYAAFLSSAEGAHSSSPPRTKP